MKILSSIFVVLLTSCLIFSVKTFSESPSVNKPELQHAAASSPQLSVSQYLASEKLDGVRGRWTGRRMLTRSGREIALPQWFTQGFPSSALDGELWIARGQFDAVSALVRHHSPDQERWRAVKFMVFDLPHSALPFERRYQLLLQQYANLSPYLKIVEQRSYDSMALLDEQLSTLVKQGAEGMMLHRKTAYYSVGRTMDLVKLKPYEDAEAIVIAHLPGKGKYLGMLGALQVKTDDGRIFKLGSGLSDEQRLHPPEIGSTVTYKYYGLTKTGLPRFATFLRVRLTQ